MFYILISFGFFSNSGRNFFRLRNVVRVLTLFFLEKLFYFRLGMTAIKTKWGKIWICAGKKGIVAIQLGGKKPVNTPDSTVQVSLKCQKALRDYFDGKGLVDLPLQLLTGTPFQRQVWKKMRSIPYGETRSYTWLAQKIGKPKSVRAVANACGANPIPILIPCHRVIASNGTLGGFSSGLHWKKRLLSIESNII